MNAMSASGLICYSNIYTITSYGRKIRTLKLFSLRALFLALLYLFTIYEVELILVKAEN